MKRCPSCSRTYTDLSLNFCLEDGTPLVSDEAPGSDPHATVRYPPIRDTDPPPTAIYNSEPPLLNQVAPFPQPRQWTPTPAPPKKSAAVWWVLGGVAVLVVMGLGLFVVLLVLASLGGNTNTNANTELTNRNTNTNANENTTVNTDTSSTRASLVDDFTDKKWGTGSYQYGDIWYSNDAYHMRSKENTYLVMYAPSNEYLTANATVRVTTRSVDGKPPASGYGLIIHGERVRGNQLRDYALLIYSGTEPQYQIVRHKDGQQTAIVPWTRSRVIRTGTSPNQLEVRTKGAELSFYINGQYINRIVDNQNIRSGVAGLYTSDVVEVAFDDLQIVR